MASIQATNGEQIWIAKISKHVTFSHYEKQNGNGLFWFDTDGRKWSINDMW
jgi:hypothetical protein